ncbi:MAG TPA: 2-oxoglutarate dehydrogenase complex dihydrolipoyllysine-residue succinyltransferase [Spirochaetia bacterium]|nr:2-oxoglutarate dehydrogenase complex dihydrolipoyllysine-residue succinyltransferase [Spirochaetia bacterium]
MKKDITVPSVGESVTQGILAAWLKAAGDRVEEGSDLFELETDKATVTVPAPSSGVLAISVAAGTEVTIGQVVGSVDGDATAAAPKPSEAPKPSDAPKAAGPKGAEPKAGGPRAAEPARRAEPPGTAEPRKQAPSPAPQRAPAEAAPAAPEHPASPRPPAPRPAAPPAAPPPAPGQRVPMTTLRKRIAERLLEAQHSTASLTTFNEVNLQKVVDLRARYKEEFERAHGVKLGFMSFFVKACTLAIAEMPVVSARIDGDDLVYPESMDVGVAVSTDRGLVVPVIRGADRLGLADLERSIADLAARARDRKILPDELTGGVFSITNGGVFGSLLSTPLLNYPQSAILGMHTIQRRPVAEEGPDGERVVIRPMMYLALTYDHRLIDGREAVSFLKRVKELVEDPWRLFIEA